MKKYINDKSIEDGLNALEVATNILDDQLKTSRKFTDNLMIKYIREMKRNVCYRFILIVSIGLNIGLVLKIFSMYKQ